MTDISATTVAPEIDAGGQHFKSHKPDHMWRQLLHNGRFVAGGIMLLLILGACVVSIPWTGRESNGHDADGYPIDNPWFYDSQNSDQSQLKPSTDGTLKWFGTDDHGRSLLSRCLYGGTVSLEIGLAAATVSVVLGVSVGLFAGYRGGWIDALLMRSVDIMYGLPYVLLIILLKIALEQPLGKYLHNTSIANRAVLFLAIGLVSWLTMARVVRGQVLTLRSQPFIEACRAIGLPSWRIFLFHLLPNIIGPIIVYATLTIPQAILSESFLSFLGIGIQVPMPTWGSLAADGLIPAFLDFEPRWWLLLFPCTLLALTLLSLNLVGDGLRDLFDPKREAAKI